MTEEDKEKALISLKWLVTDSIAKKWDAGDSHLFMLNLLLKLSPDDEILAKLYDRLANKSISVHEKYKVNYVVDELAREVYKGEGIEEAKKYKEQIISKYGGAFFDELRLTSTVWL